MKPISIMESHKGFERCSGDSTRDCFDPLIGGHHVF